MVLVTHLKKLIIYELRYEMIGRGERIAYVEYVEEEKGRETGFNEAFTFEAKLAQGIISRFDFTK
jgi:hypothetical protein